MMDVRQVAEAVRLVSFSPRFSMVWSNDLIKFEKGLYESRCSSNMHDLIFTNGLTC